MVLGEKVYMVENLQMKIFSYVMMALVFYLWPMLVRTPMVLSFLLLLQQHLILMASMSSLEESWRE
uniref:Uncharacterized protein n=1 Tax=Picea sitchensis TaxID=3332 RepID=A9NLV4_PICSI|nr:unknown [Picea sitchensis]